MNDKIMRQLVCDWRAAGVKEGDTLLIHSNTSRLLRRLAKLKVEAKLQIILESFLHALGESGTLLLPLFNFDFARGVTFDIRNSASHMGAFTEMGRLWPGAIRTGHPMYSFAAIGKNAALFRGLNNFSGYGHDSPFGVLHRLEGKIGVIDLPDQHSMTFYHYVEESMNAVYRYHKKFTGQYIDENGVETTQTYGLFVRNIEIGVNTHVEPMGEILWEMGLYTGCRSMEGSGLRVIEASKLFSEVSTVLEEGRAEGVLYEIRR